MYIRVSARSSRSSRRGTGGARTCCFGGTPSTSRSPRGSKGGRERLRGMEMEGDGGREREGGRGREGEGELLGCD